MKKVVIAIDSFKGSLSTFEAGNAIKESVNQVFCDAAVVISPIADGGEGTTEAIISATDGEFVNVMVTNPLGEKINSRYGIIPSRKTAVIEMSEAAGITLIDEKDRNPLNTTTYGVGEMIADAISKGCRKFIVGIGGSATNDGGVGMLQALGFEFLDLNKNQVELGAKGLENIVEIKTDNVLKELKDCEFCVACDVKNVLCGETGCSRIFGPQKGATEDMIKNMDLWLGNYANLTQKVIPSADPMAHGTGAAGGMGFALLAYLDATLTSGVELVMEETDIESHIKDADIVVTGEGRLDGQSYMGKAPVGVAKLAKKYGKAVIAFSGCVTDDAVVCNDHGIDAFFPIIRTPCSLSDAMDKNNAYKNLKDTALQVFKLIKVTMGE